MKKRILAWIFALMLALPLPGCARAPQRYQYQFFDTFDTVVILTLYAESEKQADRYYELAHDRFTELHRLFDAFNEYEGVANIATLNRLSRTQPVEVRRELYDLLEFCVEMYGKTDGQTNVALGNVIEAWRHAIQYEGSMGEPTDEMLSEVAQGVNVADIIFTEKGDGRYYSIYDPNMANLLDVGAVAKGYATQRVADDLREAGCTSFLISAGGNVAAGDPPADGSRDYWNVGIQNPDAATNDTASLLGTVRLSNSSMVTSGDYQRYYIADDGRRIHHIIDPDTLRPAEHFRSVTVICDNSGLADALSTALFCMDYEESRAAAEQWGVGTVWVFADGRVAANDAAAAVLTETPAEQIKN